MMVKSYTVAGINLATTVTIDAPVAKNLQLRTIIKSLYKNRHAFTLAETLITLSIIGIIAAMTVPTLHQRMQKQTYIAGLKKAHSVISQAVKLIPLSQNCPPEDYNCALLTFYDNHSSSEHDGGVQLLASQLKYGKVTQLNQSATYDDPCFKLVYADYGGCVYTNDGMIIASSTGWGEDSTIIGGLYSHVYISVDVNGLKGPNKWGRDRFRFQLATRNRGGVKEGTLMAMGSNERESYQNNSTAGAAGTQKPSKPYYEGKCTTKDVDHYYHHYSYNAILCTAKVLREGKMDY